MLCVECDSFEIITSTMKLSETQYGIAWLRQFDASDVHAARLAMDALCLVSHDRFEDVIQNRVRSIINNSKGCVALFAISKKMVDRSSVHSSEGRVGHILMNIYRSYDGQVLVEPTEDVMYAEKVKDVVLVDDIIASGQRIEDFWKAWNPKRLKSWLSFGYCRLWTVAYAIHATSIKQRKRRFPRLEREHLKSSVILEDGVAFWPPAVLDFFNRSSSRTYRDMEGLGYGSLACPVVFQHGCPDNCPAVFWSNGYDYKALFPNRSVPVECIDAFSGYSEAQRGPEILWNSGQNLLALSLIDYAGKSTMRDQMTKVMAVVGLLRRGVSLKKLASILTFSEDQVLSILESCKSLGLVNDEFRVSPFGEDLIQRSKKRFLTSRITDVDNESFTYYIPERFFNEFRGSQ